MIGRRRLRDELRRLSNSPVSVLDPMRAQQLERRVLGAARPRELELVDGETRIPPPAGRRLAAVVTLAAACVVAVVVIASLDGAGSTDRILFTSGDVEVVLPDGSVVDESSRMVVPDGSIVRLGRNGRAEFDGMTVAGVGDYLVTRDGLTLMTTSDRPRSTSPPTARRDVSPTSVAEGPAVVSRPRASEPGPATTGGRPTTTVLGPTTTTVRDAAPTEVRPPSTAQREVPLPPDTPEPRQALPESPTTSSAPTTIPPQTSSERSSNPPVRQELPGRRGHP
jgi:hypothetical protein